MTGVPDFWLRGGGRAFLLLPLSFLFRLVASGRRLAYRLRLLRSHRLPVPVLVVGNIFVGGTGKTPLVLWLARFLAGRGMRPGIITRGYGGRASNWPQPVPADGDPFLLGDEPVLLARRSGCPVMAGPDRVQAARSLLELHGCDVIVSDDGLQHYALQRDLEIVVIDAARGLGNGHVIPAGPLREPRRRLKSVDVLVANGGPSSLTGYYFTLRLTRAVRLTAPAGSQPLSAFSGKQVHVVTGIGNPDRFFAALARFGIQVIPHPFADHHPFSHRDIVFDDALPVLMTEKDAVKCEGFADERHWSVPAETILTEATERVLKARVQGVLQSR